MRKENGEEVFSKIRKQRLRQEREFSKLKIGYALTGYSKFIDEGMKYLLDVFFNGTKETNHTECPLCWKKAHYKNHEKDCN